MREGDEQVFEAVVSVPYDGDYYRVPSLRVGRGAIWAGRYFLMARAQCVGGAIEAPRVGAGPRVLLLQRRRGRVDQIWFVDVATLDVGHAILRAVGVASDQRRLDATMFDVDLWSELAYWLATILSFLPWFVVVAAASSGEPVGAAIGAVFAVLLPFAGLLARDALRAQKLSVGIDGVWIAKRGAGRFVPFVAIRAVHRSEGGSLDFELRDDTVQRTARIVAPHVAELLVARIRQGIDEAKRTPVATADQITAREELPTYRVSAAASPSPEHALVDPGASLETRMAAAVALRGRDASRLRVATNVTASPETRQMLERIENGATDEEVATFVRKRSE